jgi:hypothetical protein
MRITMTREIAEAIGRDAGNLSMQKAGRKIWSVDDYNASIDAFNKAWPDEKNNDTNTNDD